jgi:hypothetical protein
MRESTQHITSAKKRAHPCSKKDYKVDLFSYSLVHTRRPVRTEHLSGKAVWIGASYEDRGQKRQFRVAGERICDAYALREGGISRITKKRYQRRKNVSFPQRFLLHEIMQNQFTCTYRLSIPLFRITSDTYKPPNFILFYPFVFYFISFLSAWLLYWRLKRSISVIRLNLV